MGNSSAPPGWVSGLVSLVPIFPCCESVHHFRSHPCQVSWFPLEHLLVCKLTTYIDMTVGHDGQVRHLVCSPDSKWIATGGDDCTIILWDVSGRISQEWLAHTSRIQSLSFSPNSRYLVSCCLSDQVIVWKLEPSARRVGAFAAGAPVGCCVWCPNGSVIASRSDDGTICLWDTRMFRLKRVLPESMNAKASRFLRFSPDGRWLATGDFASLGIWDVTTGEIHQRLCWSERCIQDIAFDPTGARLASAFASGIIKILKVKTGEELLGLGQCGTDEVMDVSFSSDGTLVISASKDRTLKIWDARGGILKFSLRRNAGLFRAACFSLRGKYVASPSSARTVRLWKVNDGSCVATFRDHQSDVHCVALTPDGRTLSSVTVTGSVVIRQWRKHLLHKGLNT